MQERKNRTHTRPGESLARVEISRSHTRTLETFITLGDAGMLRPTTGLSLCCAVGILGLVIVTFPSSSGAEPGLVAPAKSYEAVAKALDAFIAHEVGQKGIPALSVALVDDQTIVWAKGYGFADPKTKKPATAETVYRVGSLAKLLTDIAVMQQVERGALDLDAPVTKYLPDFQPVNKFD